MKSAIENVNKSKDIILKTLRENCSSKVKQKLHGTGKYVNMLILKVVVDCTVVTTDSKTGNISLFSISWQYLNGLKRAKITRVTVLVCFTEVDTFKFLLKLDA
jgi:hypothetical protein